MCPYNADDFYFRIKNSPFFKENNKEVRIYVYLNSTCFRYFTISTNDPIWDDKDKLFKRLSDGEREKNKFLYFFIDSDSGDVLKVDKLLRHLQIN